MHRRSYIFCGKVEKRGSILGENLHLCLLSSCFCFSLFVIPCPDTESNSSGHSALDAESIAAGHSEPVSESNVTLSPFLPFTQSQNVGEDRGEGVKNE